MVRQFLLLAGVAICMSATAADKAAPANPQDFKKASLNSVRLYDQAVKMSMNDGSNVSSMQKASNLNVHWRRPAGQFWGTGLNAEEGQLGYYYTPLIVRPWVDNTFENLTKNATGTPTWTISNWSNEVGEYVTTTSDEENVSTSYLLYEVTSAPRLVYSKLGVPYPTQFYGKEKTSVEGNETLYEINIAAGYNIDQSFGSTMPVSSHYWSLFTRNTVDQGAGIMSYYGATGYESMDDPEQGGYWFGTNARGINAMATRFEKPLQPYLLNSVYWYYQFENDIPSDIPMKAYVFKTINDADIKTGTNSKGEEYSVEVAELGELLFVSDSFIPAAVFDEENNFAGVVKFEFFETNPVTGAKNAVSLEIEDDITIVVTGFDADLGNGGHVTTFMSQDEFDEGYGNLGFLGTLDDDGEGNISYELTALKDFFSSPLPNTVLGVLADVSYPWLYGFDEPYEVWIPNDGETTETEQGLQYVLALYATSMTEDWEVTFDGKDECDWIEITGVYDEMEEDDPEEYAGFSAVQFDVAPNPEDISRTCVIEVTIPAASYKFIIRQGSANPPLAVDVVTANGDAQYFDLAGRRVANPEKGIFIKKTGNKAEKVVF